METESCLSKANSMVVGKQQYFENCCVINFVQIIIFLNT